MSDDLHVAAELAAFLTLGVAGAHLRGAKGALVAVLGGALALTLWRWAAWSTS